MSSYIIFLFFSSQYSIEHIANWQVVHCIDALLLKKHTISHMSACSCHVCWLLQCCSSNEFDFNYTIQNSLIGFSVILIVTINQQALILQLSRSISNTLGSLSIFSVSSCVFGQHSGHSVYSFCLALLRSEYVQPASPNYNDMCTTSFTGWMN